MTELPRDAAGGPSLEQARRLVVKIGSALLVDQTSGEIRRDWLAALAEDLVALRRRGCEVLVVSSGAIAVGRPALGLARGKLKLEQQQAAAATGQILLAHAYQAALQPHGVTVSQVLLTLADTEERRRHLNARATLTTLLRLKAMPVINENDTVATSEIRFGDNDRLGARVAAMINADTLVLLSDIDGLYSGDPRRDSGAEHLPQVERITPEIEAMAGAAPAGYSSGGMITKLAAAKVAVDAGCRMAIASGRVLHPLRALAEGARCTWFLTQMSPRAARKQWIAGTLQPAGSVTVDAGALAALQAGKSLLPAGVTAVEGRFQRGDAVLVVGPDGEEVARGLSAYDAEAARRIAGQKSGDIETLLGYRGREELIHRDDLVVTRVVTQS
nr:glutamate 5-kinase [Algihabitans albus]